MTREQLFDAMVNQRPILWKGKQYLISQIQLEDGSGYCFNVTLNFRDSSKITVFVRCPRFNPILG